MQGLAGRIHLTPADHLLVGRVKQKVQKPIATSLFFVTLVKISILLYRGDAAFCALFGLVGLASEDNLVIHCFQIEHEFSVACLLDLKRSFHP